MIYTTREQFYTGRAWRRVSREYAASKKFLCERCLKKGLVVPYEEVHHKKRLSLANINNPEISLNWNNLECLCKKCHEQEHEADAKQRYKQRENYKRKHAQEQKRYIVDQETGKVIVIPEEES